MSFQDLENGKPLANGGGYSSSENKQDSSQAIAAGVFQMNTAVSTFRRNVNHLGTPKDTLELREKLHKARQHIGQLAKEISAKLKATSELDQTAEVSASKKIANAKLTKDFQAVLQEFQKAQRTAAERETTFAPFIPQAVVPSELALSSFAYDHTASQLSVLPDENQEKRALLVEQRRMEVIQLENEVIFNESIIEEREQGIREIQQQIGEVNEIFKDLAVLVHEQGVMIDDIDSNVESSYSTTTQAKSQLSKAAKSQKSNSSLTCLLLVIVGVVLLIVIIVLAA